MTAKKFHYSLIFILIILIVSTLVTIYVSFWFLQKKSVNLVNAKLDNIILDTQEKTFLQNRKDLEKYSTLNATIEKILPKSKDQAKAVKELYQIGDETGIIIEKIQFPTSTLGQKTAPKTGTTTSVGTTTNNVVTQAKPVEGIPKVLGIDINVDLAPSSGKTMSYDSMIRFLQKVEQNRRSMQIKQINVTPDAKNGGVTFSMILTIFIKP